MSEHDPRWERAVKKFDAELARLRAENARLAEALQDALAVVDHIYAVADGSHEKTISFPEGKELLVLVNRCDRSRAALAGHDPAWLAEQRAQAIEQAADIVESFYPPCDEAADLSAKECATNAAMAVRSYAERVRAGTEGGE